jgi:hypothetical protein
LERVVALARTWRAQALDPAVPIDGGLDRADVVRGPGYARWSSWSPFGRRDARPWVPAKVKRLEKGRDAGAVTATGRATVAAYPAEWVLGKQRLRAARPGNPFGHEPRKP